MTRILIVDDDRELVELLAFALTRAGFEVLQAHDVSTALRLVNAEQPDAAILDIGLGTGSGLDLLRTLRQRSDMVVIMLTGLDAESDKIQGLDLGADDYVTKPFSHRELISRIRAQLRRARRPGKPAAAELPSTLHVGPLSLDVSRHVATKRGVPLALSTTEFRLLHYLMAHAGSVVDTGDIMRHVWGYNDPSGRPAVRVTTYRLRHKVEDDPAQPKLLHTIPGVGLMLSPEPDPS